MHRKQDLIRLLSLVSSTDDFADYFQENRSMCLGVWRENLTNLVNEILNQIEVDLLSREVTREGVEILSRRISYACRQIGINLTHIADGNREFNAYESILPDGYCSQGLINSLADEFTGDRNSFLEVLVQQITEFNDLTLAITPFINSALSIFTNLNDQLKQLFLSSYDGHIHKPQVDSNVVTPELPLFYRPASFSVSPIEMARVTKIYSKIIKSRPALIELISLEAFRKIFDGQVHDVFINWIGYKNQLVYFVAKLEAQGIIEQPRGKWIIVDCYFRCENKPLPKHFRTYGKFIDGENQKVIDRLFG